jgi:hypothetical protein
MIELGRPQEQQVGQRDIRAAMWHKNSNLSRPPTSIGLQGNR